MKNIPVHINIDGLTDVDKEQLSLMFENTGRVLLGMLALKKQDSKGITITVQKESNTGGGSSGSGSSGSSGSGSSDGTT